MENNRNHFPNIDGLRFISAVAILFFHIELFRSLLGEHNFIQASKGFSIMGRLSLINFFVMSGFLITYLLLREEQSNGLQHITKFYVRRVLRIWPLYFMIILLTFLVVPHIQIFHLRQFHDPNPSTSMVLLYFLALPNLAFAISGFFGYASHTWSIGTEEQFYLIWPWLLRVIKRNRIAVCLGITIASASITLFLQSRISLNWSYRDIFIRVWTKLNMDSMAIGAIFAILYFQQHRLLSKLLHPAFFWSILFITFLLLAFGFQLRIIHTEFYAFLFAIIILNLAVNPSLKQALEYPTLRYLGKITYGIYMYHPFAIVLSFFLGEQCNTSSNWFIYPATLAISILLAGISSRYFESYFLRIREQFRPTTSN